MGKSLILALSFVSISCHAALKPPHDSGSYNRVISNVNHEVGRANAIGFDDSTGEFNSGSEIGGNSPTAPEIDLIPQTPPTPPTPPIPPTPTTVKLDCGCANVWLKSEGKVPSGSCFSPNRAKSAMGSAFWSRAYGNFWGNSNSVSFIGTFNIENPNNPYITKIEIQNSGSRKTVTSEIRSLGIFAFTAPRFDIGNPSCSVNLVNPARTYYKYTYKNGGNYKHGRWCRTTRQVYGVLSGQNSVKFSNVSKSSSGIYSYNKSVNTASSCDDNVIQTKYYY